MNRNNNIPVGEYAFPQNKEQFKQVLRQAREGQYMQARPEPTPEPSNGSVWEKYSAYAESLSRHPQRTQVNQSIAGELGQIPDFRQPVYSERLTPVKKKFNPLVIILPLIILIIAAAVIFFFFLNNNISYRKAEENYFGGLLQNINAVISGSEKNDSFYKADIKVSVPAAELADININEVTISADAVRQGKTVYGVLDAFVGNESFTAESWINSANGASVFLLPEVSDIYLSLKPFGENVDYAEMYRDVFGKTLNTYLELAGEPEAEKNAEFTANGSTFTADRYVIHLDGVQLATLERAFLVNTLANDAAASVLCRELGCETKDKLIEDERVKAVFDKLEQIITGERSSNACLDMTVYVKNKTVIGREAVFSGIGENEESSSVYNVVNMTNSDTPIDDNLSEKVLVNIYEIPSDKGQLTHIYYKGCDKGETFSDEIYITCEDETSGKDVHSGKVSVDFMGNMVTLNYTDLAVTKELFQGQIYMTSENNPALAMNAELTTDGENKLLNLNIPNIISADVTLLPSELEFTEAPELSEGEYTELSVNHENGDAAWEQFQNDFIEFVHRIMEVEPYDDKNGSGSNGEKDTEKGESNETGLLTDPMPDDTAETTTAAENVPESNGTTENNSDGQGSAQETEAPVTEAPVTSEVATAAPETAAPTTTLAPAPAVTYYAPSTLDTGDAQKISGAGLDRFNRGNSYTAEIYVDGGANAVGNVTVSELSGEFDGYIKGKVLKIDFAEGYEFDSALVVLTFPHSTVSGGRHYPYSEALEGMDRYMVMGSEDGDKDREIEVYKYSANQIGFIAERSGYYYVVDLDRYFYEEIGASPERVVG